jgi:ribosomal protein S18 acetylase RimI-like enzyme
MIAEIKKLIVSNNATKKGIQITCDIDEYVSKIHNYATILPYYSASQLKGFIAYYSNDVSQNTAYLTMIIIDAAFQGEGLGKLLLESSISDLKYRGFFNYRLEVLKENKKALSMYIKYGFTIQEDRGSLWLMNLNLNELTR